MRLRSTIGEKLRGLEFRPEFRRRTTRPRGMLTCCCPATRVIPISRDAITRWRMTLIPYALGSTGYLPGRRRHRRGGWKTGGQCGLEKKIRDLKKLYQHSGA